MSLYTAPTGDFVPYVKYNAKAGRWYRKKDMEEVEVQNPVFVADFANAKKAWMYFQKGQAPDVVYFPTLDAQVAQPTPNHKLGVSIMLFSNAHFGGAVRMESNSMNTCKALGLLHEQYEAAPESKQGKLPVVRVTGATAVVGNHGTNYEPVFVIEKWVDRPAELAGGATAPQATQPAPQAAPPATVASTVSEF